MKFDGIGVVDKPKLVKVLHAINDQNLNALYAALRLSDESLRRSFIRFLSLNPIAGKKLALKKLTETTNPVIAVRAAAVCLLAVRIADEK